MKYSRLTKEQFESLHEEFTFFLAAQSIDKKKWEETKTKHPEMTAALLDDFSDGIWDQSLEDCSRRIAVYGRKLTSGYR